MCDYRIMDTSRTTPKPPFDGIVRSALDGLLDREGNEGVAR